MAKFTRGFLGRSHEARDPRLPPGQYDTGPAGRCSPPRSTPKLDTATWTFAVEGLVEQPDHVDVGRDPRPAAVDLRRATSTA